MGLMKFFRRGRWDDERRAELQSYIDIETDDNIARGMSPIEARRAAHRKLGNPTVIREEVYRMNTVQFIETTTQDLRFGARVLRRNPVFAMVAILSLALGVGANTAIFQLINTVRLRTLPVANPQELAYVRVDNPPGGRSGHFTGRYASLTYAQWQLIREQQRSFSSVFAWGTATLDLATSGESKPVPAIWVSGEFFDTLGVRPVAGQLIGAAHDTPGCGLPGVVISEPFWQQEFGGKASAIGQPLHVNGVAMPVLGVSPAAFFGVEVGHRFDIAVPICAEGLMHAREESAVADMQWWWLSVIGRLKPGVTLDQASAELGAISPAIFSATVPESYLTSSADNYRKFRLKAFSAAGGMSDVRVQYSTPLSLLLSIAGLVLLIACGNLANIMLARASAREREMAVRLAIGASRRRLIRQLMAESVLIAVGGAALGAWIAGGLSRSLVTLLGRDNPSMFIDLSMDWTTLAFTTGLALATCLLFGLVPAFRATETTPASVLRAGGRGLTDGGARFTLRRALVVGQLAMSLVLLVAALLFMRTFQNLATVDTGLNTSGAVMAIFDLRQAHVAKEHLSAYKRDFLARLRQTPGVMNAASTDLFPLDGSSWNQTVVVDGVRRDGHPNVNRVSPEFFSVFGISLRAGRVFDDRDTVGAPNAAVVTREFVQTYLNDRDPIGRTFQFEQRANDTPVIYHVVGVVSDSKYTNLRDNIGPIAYLAASQETAPTPDLGVVLRASQSGFAAHVIELARATDPSILVAFKSYDELVRSSLVTERMMASLSGFFGGLAGLLAAIGLYGVMSYTVAQRRQEIGVRMALGADRSTVLWMIGREAGMLVLAGVVIGALLAAYAVRYADALLFGLKPRDPLTFSVAMVILVGVATLATLLPAIRAARLNPLAALRND